MHANPTLAYWYESYIVNTHGRVRPPQFPIPSYTPKHRPQIQAPSRPAARASHCATTASSPIHNFFSNINVQQSNTPHPNMTQNGRPPYPPGQRRPRQNRGQPGISNRGVVAICIGCCLCGPCYCLFGLLKSRCQDLHRKVTRRIERKREDRNRSPLVLLGSRPRFGYPAWPGARARPITPPPSPPAGDASLFKTTVQTGPFFTRLPLEVRRLVYDFALGADLVWLEAWGGKLVAQRCSSVTREFWSQNGRWKTAPARHYKTMSDLQYEGREYRRHAANLNLLLTCRQV